MLNELHRISATLARNNIKQQGWHREYKPLPGGDCYRVWLDNAGRVADIELMAKSVVAVCRKYGNHQRAFPAFNIAPLYRVTSDADKAYCDKLIKGQVSFNAAELKFICTKASDNWSDKLKTKTKGCLQKEIPGMPGDSVMDALMRITEKLDGDMLRTALEVCVWERLESETKTYLPLLVHKSNPKKKPEDDSGSVSIMLDLVDWELFGNPIANEKTTNQVNEWLRANVSDTQPTTADRLDAFGAPYSDIGEPIPMPRVRLAPGFEVVLRSMFREQVCQFRYGKADDSSFPISAANRDALSTSLGWIVQADNENITWRKIDTGAMLLAYPDKMPKIPPKFAGLFGGYNTNGKLDANDESRFEAIAHNFIAALNAIKPNEKPENIQVFALQQIPPPLSNRAKVVFTRDLTAKRLINAAEEWQRGCANLPEISQIELTTPFPLNVSKIANKVWKQDGTLANGKNEVTLMRYYQGMELLLDTPKPPWLGRIVRGAVSNSFGLVLFVGDNLPRNKKSIKDTLKTETGNLFPLLGLLLYKSGMTKEVYMKDTAYLIGQVLKTSDALHTLYCEVKRDGDVPPQLAGNSVFVAASETPVRALALLSTRMNPYISWAKQYRTQKKEKSLLAGWFMRQYEICMSQLGPKLTEDIRFNDLEKAQLFIGYLAELPKSENAKSIEQECVQGE